MNIVIFQFGTHLTSFIYPMFKRKDDKDKLEVENNNINSEKINKIDMTFLILFVILIFFIIIAFFFLESSQSIWFSCVFSPFGASLRYFLSSYNKKIPYFPLGTFVVNILGTIILSICFVLEAAYSLYTSQSILIHLIEGVATGFCGCLTTVSTFINELHSLGRSQAYIYAILSISAAQLSCLLTIGIQYWS